MSWIKRMGWGVVMTLLGGLHADAQLPSVVQLPSFQTFSYRGSVMVPDSGTTSLGSVRRSASGYSRQGFGRGGFRRGAGFARSFPQATVTANIIDLQEMDRQILGATPQGFVKQRQQQERDVDAVAKTERPRVMDPTAEGKSLVRYARSQYREGNESASFEAYLMAIEVLDGRLQQLATVEFRRLFGTAADQSLRMASLRR